MTDYIDRQQVIDALWKLRRQYQLLDDTQTADKIMQGLYSAEQAINDVSPVDVEPVRHISEWQFAPISADWVCMDCLEHSIEHTAYCGHCGARMANYCGARMDEAGE